MCKRDSVLDGKHSVLDDIVLQLSDFSLRGSIGIKDGKIDPTKRDKLLKQLNSLLVVVVFNGRAVKQGSSLTQSCLGGSEDAAGTDRHLLDEMSNAIVKRHL